MKRKKQICIFQPTQEKKRESVEHNTGVHSEHLNQNLNQNNTYLKHETTFSGIFECKQKDKDLLLLFLPKWKFTVKDTGLSLFVRYLLFCTALFSFTAPKNGCRFVVSLDNYVSRIRHVISAVISLSRISCNSPG